MVFDVDSTLVSIEGIDWLSRRRGSDVTGAIEALTRDAMAGRTPLQDVYGRRLQLIAPTLAEIAELAAAYEEAVAPGAADLVHSLREGGVAIRLVSGGLRGAILPLARFLGIDEEHVHAVEVRTDGDGRFASVIDSPLTTDAGKPAVLAGLALAPPVLAVGDGATDLAMRPFVDAFAAFTGFVRRASVADAADHEFGDFASLASWIFSDPKVPPSESSRS